MKDQSGQYTYFQEELRVGMSVKLIYDYNLVNCPPRLGSAHQVHDLGPRRDIKASCSSRVNGKCKWK